MTDFLSEVKRLDREANIKEANIKEADINHFVELSKVNVNEMTEKKGKFTYLSWSYAVSELLKRDPKANWSYQEPTVYTDGSMMVYCTVYAFGIYRTAQLPVLDARNNAIQNPNAMQVNTAMQRCLAKGISLHGLGLYLYRGEDLPQEDIEPLNEDELLQAINELRACGTMETLKEVYKKCYEHFKNHKDALQQINAHKDYVKESLLKNANN